MRLKEKNIWFRKKSEEMKGKGNGDIIWEKKRTVLQEEEIWRRKKMKERERERAREM